MVLRFFTFILVTVWSTQVLAESNNEVEKGKYPFMAFVYFDDERVIETNGMRFLRPAMLLRTNWLISSSMIDVEGFPQKTLLARAGTTTIEAKITLNEDEDEQETEIIQVVHPKNNSSSLWEADISLLKTLLHFNITSSVNVIPKALKSKSSDKSCSILVYIQRYPNLTEDKMLVQLPVELLPPDKEHCGEKFNNITMVCANDGLHLRDAKYEDFCIGNRGGPLLCEEEVLGIQTYIKNNCNQPHFYHVLSSWADFINCAIEEKCSKDQCSKLCASTLKDAVESTEISTEVRIVQEKSDDLTESTQVTMYEKMLTESTTELSGEMTGSKSTLKNTFSTFFTSTMKLDNEEIFVTTTPPTISTEETDIRSYNDSNITSSNTSNDTLSSESTSKTVQNITVENTVIEAQQEPENIAHKPVGRSRLTDGSSDADSTKKDYISIVPSLLFTFSIKHLCSFR